MTLNIHLKLKEMIRKFIRKISFAALACLILNSCGTTEEVRYLQDVTESTIEEVVPNPGITIEPDDLLSIIITTKDPELSAVFNMQPGTTGSTTTSGTYNNDNARKVDYGYRVDPEGNINFPTLGTIHIAGLTRAELESMIKQRILKEGLLKEFSVSISFLNFKISIIGDVRTPKNLTINDDKFTIFQALAEAGDMNITGERDQVLVIREKKGERKIYTLDLRSKEIFNSPAYYLQQNDVVYVVPNDKKAGERDINTNTWKHVGTWTGLISIAASLATMIVTLAR